jgi:hypothetical protein
MNRLGSIKFVTLIASVLIVVFSYENCGRLSDTGQPVTAQDLPSTISRPPPAPTPGPITLIQLSFGNRPATLVGTANLNYISNQFGGDLNVVVVGWNDGTSTVTNVTDTMGNTYIAATGTKRFVAADPTLSVSQIIYYARNIKAAGPGQNIVTVTFSADVPNPDIRLVEFSGFSSTPSGVVHDGASGSSISPVGNLVDGTNSNQLLFAADTALSKTISGQAGFLTASSTAYGDIIEYQVTTGPGNFNPTATLQSAASWSMQAAIFVP